MAPSPSRPGLPIPAHSYSTQRSVAPSDSPSLTDLSRTTSSTNVSSFYPTGLSRVSSITTFAEYLHTETPPMEEAPPILSGITAPKNAKGTIAFAFDIDGVLLRGKEALPGAREAIKALQDANIPFILLTNGGGLTEEKHAELLGQRLDLQIKEAQFIQSHTPFRDLVPEYGEKPVLCLGGAEDRIRHVAHAYGFKNVVIPSDFFVDDPHVHPFPEVTATQHREFGRKPPLQGEIAAILVWSSPRDWMMDLQVVTDLLLSSGGRIGTRSNMAGDVDLPDHGYFSDKPPQLFFCNPDFEWATPYRLPRLAQGGFKAALEGIFAQATGGKALRYTQFGKPTTATYEYAERALFAYNEKLQQQNSRASSNSDAPMEPLPIQTIYMIGDNPESDVAGANAFKSRIGASWRSVLVESGVYEAGTTPSKTPSFYARDVKDAVEQMLLNEGYDFKTERDMDPETLEGDMDEGGALL